MRKLRFLTVWLLLLWLVSSIPCLGENSWLIRINIPEYKLYLYRANEIYQTFNVAVGKQETPSPLGEFRIVNKVLDPTWYPTNGKPPVPAGPDNPLGKYWIGLNVDGYGIHGNSAAWSIGSPVSLGCFRLYNKDIQRLFELVPVGTPVQIIYQTVRAEIDSNNVAWLEVFPDIYNWNNPELEITKAIQNLGWKYEPHWRALGELLKAKKPIKLEVPRVIKVEGESLDIDCFCWQQEVYIAQKCLGILPVNLRISNMGALFNGYAKLDTVHATGENQQYFWDSEANTLRIIRLKVLLNGTELSDAACWGKNKQVLINLKTIAAQLGAKFSWDYTSEAAICNGVMIPGELREGIFWVAPEELEKVWPDLRCHWNEKNVTLELMLG
jgi:hypothetical protein